MAQTGKRISMSASECVLTMKQNRQARRGSREHAENVHAKTSVDVKGK